MVEQTTGVSAGDSPEQPAEAEPAGASVATAEPAAHIGAGPGEGQPAPAAALTGPDISGFSNRGRVRRRARFLHRARELAYRDLGGLVYNLHRFGQRNDPLVLAKLATLKQIDTELRSLQDVLGERHPVTVLREAGITACPRCAAIHSSEDAFCPSCGLSLGRNAELPIAGQLAPSTGAPPLDPHASLTAPAPGQHTNLSAPAPAQHPSLAAPASTAAPAPTAPEAPAPTPADTTAPTDMPAQADMPAPADAPAPAAATAAAIESQDARTPGRQPQVDPGEEEQTAILHPPPGGP